jgi:hypothetical protein
MSPGLDPYLHRQFVSCVLSGEPDRIEFRAAMLEVATEVVGGTPEELRKLQIAEIEKYKRIAQAANIKAN